MRVVFVHGACVRDGEWWWHRAAAALAEHGVGSVAPGLPSCGEGGSGAGPAGDAAAVHPGTVADPAATTPDASGPGLIEDVAAVRAAITAGGEPVVVVGHSYGGIVAAGAAAGLDVVRHLLLVSSYLPEPGESLSTFGPAEPAPFLEVDPEGGTFTVRADALAGVFLQDCDLETRRAATERIARQSLAVLEAPVRAAAWHDVPSTYLVCADDLGTPAAAQRRFAERAGRVVELNAGHHPFLSQPEAVRDLVLGLG